MNVVPAGRALGPLVSLLLGLGSVTGGCSADGQEGASASPERSAVSPTSTPSPAYDPLPWRAVDGPLGRCGPLPQRVADQRYQLVSLRGPAGAVLPAVTAGHGRTVAILVHQTDGNGLCGWLSFAQHLAGVPGVRALALDLCTYGEARCEGGYVERQTDQVRLAVDHALETLHAERVVLVGASMGGSLAVLTAARDHRVDAVVDLSGPDEWAAPAVHVAARGLEAPTLFAVARDEGEDEVAAMRKAAASAPRGSELALEEAGHGYELLEEPDGRPTGLSGRVLAWVRGR
ncbi:alpha/beta hydrolase [Nocardioides sp. MAHUQ-72]|uniref:alpha/beta hydrolase n=1 Tax=unclassified Nocardioides TaxID=2615069 RepID=UPI00361D07C1